MSNYIITLEIVGGILTPFIIIGLVYLTIGFVEYLKTLKEYQIEKKKLEAPFDTVETSPSFEDTKTNVIFYKDKEIVWEGKL